MMRRISITALVLVSTLAVGIATPAFADSALPTQRQLQNALIGPSDLPAGFTMQWTGTLTESGVSAGAIFTRSRPVFELVAAGIGDGRGTAPSREAADYVRAMTGSSDYQAIPAPQIGGDTVRFIFITEQDGTTLFGDVVAWRQGDVVVIVAVVSEDITASPVPYAQRQATRLARALS